MPGRRATVIAGDFRVSDKDSLAVCQNGRRNGTEHIRIYRLAIIRIGQICQRVITGSAIILSKYSRHQRSERLALRGQFGGAA